MIASLVCGGVGLLHGWGYLLDAAAGTVFLARFDRVLVGPCVLYPRLRPGVAAAGCLGPCWDHHPGVIGAADHRLPQIGPGAGGFRETPDEAACFGLRAGHFVYALRGIDDSSR